MNASPLLELCEVSKSYRGRGVGARSVRAVDRLSLSVAPGEVFGFVGPNGAGKSTTIKIITGGITRFDGRVQLFGREVSDPMSRLGLGFVPENPYLNDYLTPLEVVLMGMALHRTRVDNPRAHALKWLDRLELSSVANKSIRTFSKGMTQRVTLAHALAINPRLLVLDEPLSGLDPVGRKDVVDILSEYKHQGGAIFFTSHVLHDVERLADRFGLIHQGVLRSVQSPAELLGQEQRYVVRSMGDKPIDGMSADSGGRWQGEIGSAGLWALLRQVESAGHLLMEVRPALSLESAFLELVRKESPSD